MWRGGRRGGGVSAEGMRWGGGGEGVLSASVCIRCVALRFVGMGDNSVRGNIQPLVTGTQMICIHYDGYSRPRNSAGIVYSGSERHCCTSRPTD